MPLLTDKSNRAKRVTHTIKIIQIKKIIQFKKPHFIYTYHLEVFITPQGFFIIPLLLLENHYLLIKAIKPYILTIINL